MRVAPRHAIGASRLRLDDPDVALMLRVQRGDPGAFARLVEVYWNQIFGRCYRLVSDRQEAEDLAQEVFLRVYRHRRRYLPQARFATWLFHITQNVARNAIRSRRRHPSVRLEYLTNEETHIDDGLGRGSELPIRPLERAELAGIVRSAVGNLALRQRTAVELHQFQDHTYAEVAKAMRMTPKAAKSLLYRARNVLRRTLAGMKDEG
jgi:RNA polymerase sigma-70 factor (ECF subfamily)